MTTYEIRTYSDRDQIARDRFESTKKGAASRFAISADAVGLDRISGGSASRIELHAIRSDGSTSLLDLHVWN